jgi:hypothetical protein
MKVYLAKGLLQKENFYAIKSFSKEALVYQKKGKVFKIFKNFIKQTKKKGISF